MGEVFWTTTFLAICFISGILVMVVPDNGWHSVFYAVCMFSFAAAVVAFVWGR